MNKYLYRLAREVEVAIPTDGSTQDSAGTSWCIRKFKWRDAKPTYDPTGDLATIEGQDLSVFPAFGHRTHIALAQVNAVALGDTNGDLTVLRVEKFGGKWNRYYLNLPRSEVKRLTDFVNAHIAHRRDA